MFVFQVVELGKIGGTNCYNFVKRILSNCLTNDNGVDVDGLDEKEK